MIRRPAAEVAIRRMTPPRNSAPAAGPHPRHGRFSPLTGLGMRGRRRRGDDGATKLAGGQEVQPVLMASRPRHVRREPHDLTDGELAARVYRLAPVARSPLDPPHCLPLTPD